jgi:hypothetical protein
MGLGCGLSSKKNLETDGILYVLVEMGLGGALSFKKNTGMDGLLYLGHI